MTNLLHLHHYTIYGNTHVNVYLPRNGLPRHCRQWLFFSFYRRHLLSPSPPKTYWGHRLCFWIEIAGETEMAADDKFPPLTPILLLPHVIFVSLFLSWSPCSGFGIEMAAKTEMADNHFHPPTPILVLPHVVFSLIFLSSRQFLLQNQIHQLILRLLPHLSLLQQSFWRKLRL